MSEAIKPSQQFVALKEIKNGVVCLKSGGLRKILVVGGINFDLKSEPEQNLILHGFQNFLNTLDFSVQIFIHSRKTNINLYLEKMAERLSEEQNELMKIQIEEYIKFIKGFIEENAIITKTFFVVVPYDPVVLVAQAKGFFGLFGGKSKKTATEKTEAENREKENLAQLEHRVDQTISAMEEIGLRAAPLNDEELVELFYNLYNPQLVEKTELEIAKK